jgi:hypothetical protein
MTATEEKIVMMTKAYRTLPQGNGKPILCPYDVVFTNRRIIFDNDEVKSSELKGRSAMGVDISYGVLGLAAQAIDKKLAANKLEKFEQRKLLKDKTINEINEEIIEFPERYYVVDYDELEKITRFEKSFAKSGYSVLRIDCKKKKWGFALKQQPEDQDSYEHVLSELLKLLPDKVKVK